MNPDFTHYPNSSTLLKNFLYFLKKPRNFLRLFSVPASNFSLKIMSYIFLKKIKQL